MQYLHRPPLPKYTSLRIDTKTSDDCFLVNLKKSAKCFSNTGTGNRFWNGTRAVWAMETKQIRQRQQQRLVSIAETALEVLCLWYRENNIENQPKATKICWMWCLLSQMFTLDSRHTRSRHKIRAQLEQGMFGVVNCRQFGANYVSVI